MSEDRVDETNGSEEYTEESGERSAPRDPGTGRCDESDLARDPGEGQEDE